MKSIFLQNLSPLRFLLAIEKWHFFFTLILIHVLEYEKKSTEINIFSDYKMILLKIKNPVTDTFHVVQFSIVKCRLLYTIVVLLVIRSVSDVLRAQSRLVKFVGGEAAGRTPYTFYKPTLGPKYVRNRPYNEFITPSTFI